MSEDLLREAKKKKTTKNEWETWKKVKRGVRESSWNGQQRRSNICIVGDPKFLEIVEQKLEKA